MSTKLVIGVCSGGTMRVETVASLFTAMFRYARETDSMPNLLFQIGGYVDINRNKIIQEAQKAQATHILFVDNDMIFPEDAILTLMNRNKDIIGANYNVRLDPTSEVLSGPTTKMLVNGVPVSMMDQDFPTKIFKCYAVATGFMMVKMKVFNKLQVPYFDAWIDENNNHSTEDVDFCRKAGEKGFEIFCDPTIKMGHIGSYTY